MLGKIMFTDLKELAYNNKKSKIRRPLKPEYKVVCSFYVEDYDGNYFVGPSFPMNRDISLIEKLLFQKYSYNSFYKTFETIYNLCKNNNKKAFYIIFKEFGEELRFADVTVVKIPIVNKIWLFQRIMKQLNLIVKQYSRATKC